MIMMKKILAIVVIGLFMPVVLASAEEGVIARVGQSGEYLDLVQQESGHVLRDYIPLHQSGGVSYFAAGVGVEERTAQYPFYSLKMVFTAGGKPFLTGVDVVIQGKKEGPVITIPGEQVNGPWLFVDLPAGSYEISASKSDRKQELTGIKIEAGNQKTVHLRWADDPGLAVTLPRE